MQNDALLFGLIFVGFFVLWAVTGGPTRPISFAGAYITPITNVDSKQTGYGPKVTLDHTLSLGGSSISSSNRAGAAAVIQSKDSIYKDQIFVVRSGAYFSADPANRYVHLIVTSHARVPVRINDWRFISSANNATVIISNSDASLYPDTSTTVVTTFPANTPHDTITLKEPNGQVVSSYSY